MRRGSASILADSGAGFSRALAGAAETLGRALLDWASANLLVYLVVLFV
jgi:hypothetical protein